MAQPSYAIEYLGAEYVEGGKVLTSTDIKAKYPSATVIKMKTDKVTAYVGGTVGFLTSFDDETYIPTTNITYTFSTDCIIAIGRYVAI